MLFLFDVILNNKLIILFLVSLTIITIFWPHFGNKKQHVELFTYVDHFNKIKYIFNDQKGTFVIQDKIPLDVPELICKTESVNGVLQTKYYKKSDSLMITPILVFETQPQQRFKFVQHYKMIILDPIFNYSTDRITFLTETVWLLIAQSFGTWKGGHFTIVYDGYAEDARGNKVYGSQTITKSAIKTVNKTLDNIFLECLLTVTSFEDSEVKLESKVTVVQKVTLHVFPPKK